MHAQWRQGAQVLHRTTCDGRGGACRIAGCDSCSRATAGDCLFLVRSWLIFSLFNEAIRLHFGMAGSVQCGSHQPAAQSRKQLTLLIRFESADGTSHADELRVYDSSAVLADAAAAAKLSAVRKGCVQCILRRRRRSRRPVQRRCMDDCRRSARLSVLPGGEYHQE